MSKHQSKYSTIHYESYLKLQELLSIQNLRSEAVGDPAHEETLFIIVHQVYELWFKQVIHEMTSVINMFSSDSVDEKNIGTAIGRLDRIVQIQKLLIEQIRVMETMTPMDFLEFRNYLFPASGFQSFQFRQIEVMMGLQEDKRLTYNNYHYASVFDDKKKAILEATQAGNTLFGVIEGWLERTPFLNFGEFDFLSQYRDAVSKMLKTESTAISDSTYLSETEKEQRLKMLAGTDSYFDNVFDEDKHKAEQEAGHLRLSYKATIAALLINLYRDEPILHNPFRMLMTLIDIDELFTMWRYRHAQMVMRMLGRKMGTGGSSGFDYLQATASKHQVFRDLHNISTLLIPRSDLPVLPDNIKKELGFYFSEQSK